MSSRSVALASGFALLSLSACGKSLKTAPDAGAGPLVAPPPPAVVASSQWLEKKADGTYAINTIAECTEALASAPPELALAALTAARGIVATLPSQDTVAIAPLGLRARFPRGPYGPSWLRAAPSGVAALRTSDREWEIAYADLLNQALPFDSLLFHMGEGPWQELSAVEVLYVRLYAVTESVDDTMNNLRTRLPALSQRVACQNVHSSILRDAFVAKVTTSERSPWKSVRATMNLWYADYGGTAVVELFVRRVEPVTVVLAYMFEGEDTRRSQREVLLDVLAKP